MKKEYMYGLAAILGFYFWNKNKNNNNSSGNDTGSGNGTAIEPNPSSGNEGWQNFTAGDWKGLIITLGTTIAATVKAVEIAATPK